MDRKHYQADFRVLEGGFKPKRTVILGLITSAWTEGERSEGLPQPDGTYVVALIDYLAASGNYEPGITIFGLCTRLQEIADCRASKV